MSIKTKGFDITLEALGASQSKIERREIGSYGGYVFCN
jgi:hypothetical protein